MSQSFAVYFGDVIEEDSENRFLNRLLGDLARTGLSGTLLANFTIKRHQIDFVVLVDGRCFHIELKSIATPIYGDKNGMWNFGDSQKNERRSFYAQALQQKYELSDAMLLQEQQQGSCLFSAANKPYKHIVSVVCVFPALHPDSAVYSDDWVHVIGYSKLLSLITAPTGLPHHPWTAAEWKTFFSRQGLRTQEEYLPFANVPSHNTKKLDEYTERFRGHHELTLRHFLEPAIADHTGVLSASDLVHRVASHKITVLAGPSGAGKTFAATKLALESLSHKYFPIIAPAGRYRGRLSSLLTFSIAPFSTEDWSTLTSLAQQVHLVPLVVLDAVDDCPTHLRQNLYRDVLSLMQQSGSAVCITSRRRDDFPAHSAAEILTMGEVAPAFRESLVALLAPKGLPPAATDLLSRMSTPLEISLAVECATEASSVLPTPQDLVGAYIRKCLSESVGYAFGRRLLGIVAVDMCNMFRADITLERFFETALTLMATGENRNEALDRLTQDVRLLELTRGVISFRHEAFKQYCAGSQLRASASSGPDLVAMLQRPELSEVVRYAIAPLTDRMTVADILKSCGRNDHALVADAASGKLGSVAYSVVSDNCDCYIALLEGQVSCIDVVPDTIDLQTGYCELFLNDHDAHEVEALPAITRCIRAGLVRGERLGRVLRLVGNMEEAFLSRLEANVPAHEGHALKRVGLHSAYVFGRLPTAKLVSANAAFFPSSATAEVLQYVESCCKDIEQRSVGELSLLLQLIPQRWTDVEEIIPSVIALVNACLYTKVHFLQLYAIQRFEQWAWQEGVAGGPGWHQLCKSLELFASTPDARPITYFLEHALASAGDTPPDVVEEARRQAILITSVTRSFVACDQAASWMTNLIESPATKSYGEAYRLLDNEAKARLLAYACHAKTENTSWADYAIGELFATRCDNEDVRSAFRMAASRPPQLAFSPQEATSFYITGVRGCGRVGADLPAFEERDALSQAWAIVGEIVFYGERYQDDDQWRTSSQPLWDKLRDDLLFETIGPLRDVANIGGLTDVAGNYSKCVQRLYAVFRDRLCDLLTIAARNPSKITSSVIQFGIERDRNDLLAFCLSILGQLRCPAAKPVLEPWLRSDDPAIRRAAVAAIRTINNGGVFEKLERVPMASIDIPID